MDRGAWWAALHGVAKSRTRLSNFTFTFHFHALEKEMATHSSVLAWRIPGTREPDGLPSMGSHRVGHEWSDLAAAAADSREALGFEAMSSVFNRRKLKQLWERQKYGEWCWLLSTSLSCIQSLKHYYTNNNKTNMFKIFLLNLSLMMKPNPWYKNKLRPSFYK